MGNIAKRDSRRSQTNERATSRVVSSDIKRPTPAAKMLVVSQADRKDKVKAAFKAIGSADPKSFRESQCLSQDSAAKLLCVPLRTWVRCELRGEWPSKLVATREILETIGAL